jgi:hypothetical protein
MTERATGKSPRRPPTPLLSTHLGHLTLDADCLSTITKKLNNSLLFPNIPVYHHDGEPRLEQQMPLALDIDLPLSNYKQCLNTHILASPALNNVSGSI